MKKFTAGTTENSTKNIEHSYEIDQDLPGIIKVDLSTTKYMIDAPTDLYMSKGTAYKIETDSYFIIYDQYVDIASEKQFGVDLSNIKKADQVIEGLTKQLLVCAEFILPYSDNYAMKIDHSDDVIVNGWDMCKQKGAFELTAASKLPYNSANFVSYSLLMDGYPVCFVVGDKPDGSERIDIEAMADKIATTFREYSED